MDLDRRQPPCALRRLGRGQDHVNGNLLFAGLEFGVWFTVDGGQSWTQLKAGLPTIQARDLVIQRREHDLVVGTFGRGTFVLDDYSALRELTPQVLTEEARLLPLRDTYLFEELGQQQAAWGNETTPNPPVGAVFTYAVGKEPEGDAKLVLTITDDAGRQVRRLDVPRRRRIGRPGTCRATCLSGGPRRGRTWRRWNDGGPGAGAGAGAGGGRGRHGAGSSGASAGRNGGGDQRRSTAAGIRGRGGPQAPLVAPGRYRATLGDSGETVTAIGSAQSFK